MTKEERIEKKKTYKGPKYEVLAGDVGRPCKACGVNLHFVPTENPGKYMPVEYDGIPHWGFCSDPGRFGEAHRRQKAIGEL